MRFFRALSFCITYACTTLAHEEAFEPDDFNVVNALAEHGVDVSSIPELFDLVAQSSSRSCASACGSLRAIFGDAKVTSTPPETYWSLQQSQVQPSCTFSPNAAMEVAIAVLLARLFQCQFAVKSGGHAAFAGASSVEGGITIDLVNMNERKISANTKTVAIGPGNRWKDVYDYLKSYNLAVVGGRAASVGVGGLTLGGGISHHTNAYGLACDNVASYELVTASGKILLVSETSYPDLYFALRGGGNNFGIVTTFNYETLPQDLMFASNRQYNATHIPALLDAFTHAVQSAERDTQLAHFVAIAYASGVHVGSAEFEYTTPFPPSDPPQILKEYLSIPTLRDDTRNSTLADTTLGLTASMPAGLRTTMWSQSFQLDGELMKRLAEHFFTIAPGVPGFAPSLSFQGFSVPALRAMQKKGGNALGLDPDSGPLFHILFYVSWQDEKDDKVVMSAAQGFMAAVKELATAMGREREYVYMPYSSPYQEVVDGYGAENVERLKGVARKFDPRRVWEKLQPGYFKLEGAPFGTAVA